jgi:TPP-dependent 2-oxoacid decarboxylase
VKDEIREKYDAKLKKLQRVRQNAAPGTQFEGSNDIIHHSITDEVVSEFIIVHIVVEELKSLIDEIECASGEHTVVLSHTASEGEQEQRAMAGVPAPAVKSDVTFERRRSHPMQTMKMDFESQLEAVRDETSEIKKITAVAAIFEASTKKKRNRWQKAIKMVIVQNAVAEYTKQIDGFKAVQHTRKGILSANVYLCSYCH